MAKVRFGTGVAEIRGSVGGSVYSRTHSAAIVRNRIVPVNPNTQSQDDLRALFATVAYEYTQLSPSERQAWEDFAALVDATNVFGEKYTPTGRQIFQQCNMNIALANSAIQSSPGGGASYVFAFTPVTAAPAAEYATKPAPPAFVGDDKSFTVTVTAGAITAYESVANFIPPNATDDIQRWIIEATDIFRPTVRNRARMFRLVGSQATSIAAPLDIVSDWNTLFGGLTYQAGQTGQLLISTVNKGGIRSDKVLVNVEAA